jgi:hypothetical protein
LPSPTPKPKKKFFDEPEPPKTIVKEDEGKYFAVHLRVGPAWIEHCQGLQNVTEEERLRCLPREDIVPRLKNIRRLGDFTKMFLSIDDHEEASEVLEELESLSWVVRFTTPEQKALLPK